MVNFGMCVRQQLSSCKIITCCQRNKQEETSLTDVASIKALCAGGVYSCSIIQATLLDEALTGSSRSFVAVVYTSAASRRMAAGQCMTVRSSLCLWLQDLGCPAGTLLFCSWAEVCGRQHVVHPQQPSLENICQPLQCMLPLLVCFLCIIFTSLLLWADNV